MTEGERIQLYNDLCDYTDELEQISYPSQTRRISILARAVAYVRGESARWLTMKDTQQIIHGDRLAYLFPMQCSSCHFDRGFSDFRLCPQCGSRMQKR